jgi:hypothetical protein
MTAANQLIQTKQEIEMKVQIKGLVHEVDYGFGEKEYRMYGCDMSGQYYSLIGPAEFTYEVPDDFNPIPSKLAAIETAKAAALAEYREKVAELNDQASKLQALPNYAETA